MIIYLLTFYLFDDIEKQYRNHSCESFCTSKTILTKMQKSTCNLYVYIFYLRFTLCVIHGDRCDRKTPKNNDFIQVKPLCLAIEFSNTVTFSRNARFDVIFTSVTIIRQVFLRKLFCYESLVDIEVSNHLNIFSLTRLKALVVVTSSLTSTP